MLPFPVCVAILSQDVTKARFGFGAEIDQGKRRSQLILPFVSSSCHRLPKRAFVPGESFKLIDAVTNNTPLWFDILGSRVGERTSSHALFDLGYQRGTTVGTNLQGLASAALTGVVVQLEGLLVEGRAARVKVVVRIARGPS